MNSTENLPLIGWNNTVAADKNIARIITVDRNSYLVSNGQSSWKTRLTGSFSYYHDNPVDTPCVGDWVLLNSDSCDDRSLITEVIERRNCIKRKAVGKSSDYQLIAANVDFGVIIQSCHYDFNINRLERYLVMLAESSIEPIILLTKSDLVSPDYIESIVAQIANTGIDLKIMTISNITGAGVEDFYNSLIPQSTYCFIGSSGVGKSSLINHLTGKSKQSTQAVSQTGEGRHTTVKRELILLPNKALVIDNPGMRELGIISAEEGLAKGYSEIFALAQDCKFRNCSHTTEPGCQIIEALQNGTLSDEQWENFNKLKNESDRNGLSNFEKRQKDKSFGKYVKSVKKEIKRRKDWR